MRIRVGTPVNASEDCPRCGGNFEFTHDDGEGEYWVCDKCELSVYVPWTPRKGNVHEMPPYDQDHD